MSDFAFGMLGLVIIGPFFVWTVVRGLSKGRIWSRFGPDFRRDKQPILFWLSVVTYGVIATVTFASSMRMVTSSP
ncbi:hypothetical protein SPHINGO361_120322 [Sphingomonas sp. EC-HK361]|uniref:hypothetical protein n=1 Tax=Sphingomonas sp. EC-HK361 TaxID=2038397 RepID=UPI00125C097B|nr:hypothetical protein [Sphingomonas sp. EC-HK361]VVT08343.1 hypothetical protein SPHINGO361_120322 [Sphingomonas sp. EC-HK361]